MKKSIWSMTVLHKKGDDHIKIEVSEMTQVQMFKYMWDCQ